MGKLVGDIVSWTVGLADGATVGGAVVGGAVGNRVGLIVLCSVGQATEILYTPFCDRP